jgi:hypothetical protein
MNFLQIALELRHPPLRCMLRQNAAASGVAESAPFGIRVLPQELQCVV